MSKMTGLSLPAFELPELLARTRDGDSRAFVDLVTQYQPLVFRWAVALSGDKDEAEDITQEVFVRVHRKLSAFRGDGPFEAWLYRIARRVALRTRHALPPAVIGPDSDMYETDPGARVDRQRAVALIQNIARSLPERQREVFVLCDLEGRAPSEVAALLDMKDVSVRASLFKARATIRRMVLATHPGFSEKLP